MTMKVTMMFRSVILAAVFSLPFLLSAFAARAEVSKVTVAAAVKSFDDKHVLVQVNKRTVRIPRELVTEKDLKVGSAIFITFRGTQIGYLFDKSGAPLDQRSPASQKAKSRSKID